MKLLTVAQRVATAVCLISLVILALDFVETKHELDRAKLDHDALLVRIAVFQGQIDAREKADREDEESRLQEQQKLREQEDFTNRWQPTAKELEAIQRMQSDDPHVRSQQGLENAKEIQKSMELWQRTHDAGR